MEVPGPGMCKGINIKSVLCIENYNPSAEYVFLPILNVEFTH